MSCNIYDENLIQFSYYIFFNYFYKKLSKRNVIKRNNMKLTLIFHEMKISLLNNNQKKLQNLEKKYHQLMIKNDKIKE